MNFLAHIYLSGDSDEILIGNFIGDYVKGNSYKDYQPMISKGIMLHRNIDSFTDHHQITKESKEVIREKYGLYSGIVIDIFYDHFLANNWSRFSDQKLSQYIHDRHDVLCQYFNVFPAGVKKFFPYFVKSNWLEAYANFDGLESVLRRMAYHTTLPDHSEYAIKQLKAHYDDLDNGFIKFFQEITDYVKKEHGVRF